MGPEPLGPNDTDFLNSARDTLKISDILNHSAVKVQLDAKALVENKEDGHQTFEITANKLVHFHANEPSLGILGSSGLVDHAKFAKSLKTIGYSGYISIEQRQFDPASTIQNIKQSIVVLKNTYGRILCSPD